MMQRASAPPRGPRGASPSVRGRGGIQKRRAGGPPGPTRVDRDGDLVMDAIAADKGGSGRGRIRASTPSKTQGASRSTVGPLSQKLKQQKHGQAIERGMGGQQANVIESRITTGPVCLQVAGHASSKAASNPDGGLQDLLAFLEKKASTRSNRTIKITKSHEKGDSVIIYASPEDIAEIEKLNNFQFAGATLTIKPRGPPPPRTGKLGDKNNANEASPTTTKLKDGFRSVLAGRYDVELKLLNLSALAQDAGLVEMGLFNGHTQASKVFPALMAVCDGLFETRQAKRDAILSVTLTDNGILNVSEVAELAYTFPDLKNLDLSRNNITSPKDMDAWRSKFRHLENLVLAGNPIEAELPKLKDEILRRYPRLQFLNGVQLRTLGEVAAINSSIEAAQTPIPIAGPDFRDVGQVGENFIRQFLALYDTNRGTLLTTYYDSQTTHSISINMSAPKSADRAIPPWAPYKPHSRNLVKLTNLQPRMNRTYKGVEAIRSAWATLPATRHPDLQTHAEKYIIECQPIPGLTDPSGQSVHGVDGLMITMHGEFEEEENNATITSEKALRSFSRTFVLGPGPPGGLPIRVVSDMMVLRAYGPLAQPQILGNSVQAEQTTNPVQQNQEALAMQLTEKTGMTLEYSVLCLSETGWDLEKAYVAFTTNKANLPPTAFLAGAVH